ncbi:putative glyoxalase/bleomycin resistance protein/dioxygenase [Legionella cincinnatiensis]|uniref:Glyoxalase/bleomycin resistance protein/dioxygenase n=2 Tax=Legionella cincinnatiensis TaxID=28085 RepID=A0A378IMN2_9GAMM|nr:putative glyoxalase/bleomycin resistance protein/dioxygenase [Legionella cincinnatiensis]STX35915.1 putative glyoxalase/bleomycin resistance protein/dioxygenase [Legionella cincinnatiensis]
MKINRLDHLVLTVADVEKSCQFYERALGMTIVTFGDDRKALLFGQQKINLHQLGKEIKPNAKNANTGTGDLCFIADTDLKEVIQHLLSCNVQLESDIVERTGAIGKLRSIYLRDPDDNLIEISNYL